MGSIDAFKTINLQPASSRITTGEEIAKKNHYLFLLAIPLAISYWFLDSFIHYFWYDELKFEIIPTDGNDLWMRITIGALLVSFGFFADFTSRRLIEKNNRKVQSESITRAKKQWELVVDSLPQLVIAMDDNARITRVNRTIETWGIGKVNKVDGLYVSDFLKCFNKNYTDDAWTSDWTFIWQQIKNKDLLSRKIEKENTGKTYLYTLRKIPDYDADKDQCYAVLVIDDITTRQDIEESLKAHAQNLENQVNKRTLELKHSNEKLEHELHISNIAKEELKRAQICRLNLLRGLFTAQEADRKRIACELHDSIGQSLGATKFKIEELLINRQNFINDNERDQFNHVVETIKNSINEVRHIAMDLRPAMLDDLGVLATLKWFCREFENTYIDITVKLLLNVNESDISHDKKIVIFRIIQEAFNNIAKHANATYIVLELNNSNSSLIMQINDNGCGCETDLLINKKTTNWINSNNTLRCSFGLSSMRERAESTNGEFIIKSTPGSGTYVIVSWKN